MGEGVEDAAAVFTGIYRELERRDLETVLGLGSTIRSTARLRRLLPDVLGALGISTMLDAPCGDLNWMDPATLPIGEYLGADIVPGVVERAREASGGVEISSSPTSPAPPCLKWT